MIYSKTSEYAIRILVCLAKQGRGSKMKIKGISRSADVPEAYTAKVLQFLAKKKFLLSVPGPNGGFSLLRDPGKISVYEVLAAVDDFPRCPFADCIMGLKECGDKNPCILHDAWIDAKKRITKILADSTVRDLLVHPSSFRMGARSRRMLSRSMRSIFKK
jgi:Rrf2 family protein